jgi:hypothetical protein
MFWIPAYFTSCGWEGNWNHDRLNTEIPVKLGIDWGQFKCSTKEILIIPIVFKFKFGERNKRTNPKWHNFQSLITISETLIDPNQISRLLANKPRCIVHFHSNSFKWLRLERWGSIRKCLKFTCAKMNWVREKPISDDKSRREKSFQGVKSN